jgi:modulator of FtsH protease
MDEWQGFFAAQLGASATLSGLILVGVSINLTKILSDPKLPNRAIVALVLLLTVLIVSSLLLVPGQSVRLVGIEVLIIGLFSWTIVTGIDVRTWKAVKDRYNHLVFVQLAMDQLSLVPYTIAGITIVLQGFIGFYWLVPAVLFSFIKAIVDSWVLLVEIDR